MVIVLGVGGGISCSDIEYFETLAATGAFVVSAVHGSTTSLKSQRIFAHLGNLMHVLGDRHI